MEERQLVRKIIERQGRLEEKRSKWEEVWKEITELVIPYFDMYIQEDTGKRGQKLGSKVFNGIPVNAAQFFANGLQGYTCSQYMKWFMSILEDEKLNDLAEVMEWSQELDKLFYSVFQKSNFYSSINEMFRVGGTICTSTLYVEEDIQKDMILFNTRHPIEIYIDVNKYNQVDTVYRKFKVSARVAIQIFGEENLSPELVRTNKSNPDTEFEFLHAVEPREDRKEWKRDAKNKRIASYYIELGKERLITNKLARESGYDLMPYLVWRPEKNFHQVYGGGPGMNALVDISGLNQISKDLLHAAELSIKPPMQANERMRGLIRVIPGGISYFEKPEDVLKPVYDPINFPVGVEREEKIETIIRKHYFVDFFMLVAQAEKERTATEINYIQGEKSVMLGPMIGNLSNDVLNPLFDIVFSKLLAAGKVPPPPRVLEKYGGKDIIKIDYLGPLAQAQKRLFRSQGITAGMQSIEPILQFKPELADIIDWDKVIREMLEAQGMPQKVIRSPEDVKKIRFARAQALQQQQALEAMDKMASAAGKINKRTEEGSLLEKVEGEATKALKGA